MKKFNIEYLSLFTFGLFAIALITKGVVDFAGALMVSLPIYQAVIYIALGAILFTVVKAFFALSKLVSILSKTVENITSFRQTTPTIDFGTSITPEGGSPIMLKIDATTPPEEIEKLKQQFPMLSKTFDLLCEQSKTFGNLEHPGAIPKEKDITKITLVQLEGYLNKAVEENDFEKAAKIRDEIKNRGN